MNMRQLSRILDAQGNRMPMPRRQTDMRAYLDVSYTHEENAEHWGWARHGDANSNLSTRKRFDARRRARYETQNNNFLLGLVDTIATDVVGPGPKLEMLSENTEDNQRIERDWEMWTRAIDLPNKLWTMARAKVVDGEVFGLALFREAVDHEVKLDLQVIESDQCGNPMGAPDNQEQYDGIRQDNRGFPIEYYLYDLHPYSLYIFPVEGVLTGQWYSPERIIHLFKQGRPGQLRGVTELAACLPISAVWRRYVLATTISAENVANVAMALKTNTSAEIEFQPLDPLTTFPHPRNQMWTVPEGWEPYQIKAEQPTDTFEQFDRCLKLDMARSLGMPATIGLLNSSDYNYASARVDHVPYKRMIDTVRQSQFELRCLEKIFNIWIRLYVDAEDNFAISTSDVFREYPHRWAWPPHEHFDPAKAADATETLMNLGLKTDDDFLYEQAKDPETHYRQLERQAERRKQLGMPMPGVQPGIFEPQPAPASASRARKRELSRQARDSEQAERVNRKA